MKNLKASKKRFNDGGLSEDKEAGLKASKGEDVGFFERLRMGNIDDPKSEAYKRFGAGRGASERGKNAGVVDQPVTRSLKAAVSMPEDDTETRRKFSSKAAEESPVFEDQNFGTKVESAGKPTLANVSAPKRQPVYQADKLGGREKMSASDSIPKDDSPVKRNSVDQIPTGEYTEVSDDPEKKVTGSERGRRLENVLAGVGGAGATAAAIKAKKMYDAAQKAKSLASREEVLNPLAWMAGPKNMGEFSKSASSMAKSAKDSLANAASKVKDKFKPKRLSEMDTTGGAVGYRKGGMTKKYANGGSVSASRGDGIAQRGKTRGKMC